MKVKSITLNNFAGYKRVTADFDSNLNFLIGSNGAGKSTLGLTGVWMMFQGIGQKAGDSPQPLIGERFRFIGAGSATSTNEMILIDELRGNAEIKVVRIIKKAGSTLSFSAPEDYPEKLDQNWLNNLFNIFLIAPKKFLSLSGIQQARALGIDTTSHDTKIANLKNKYTELNAVYKAYGELPEVEKVEKVDVEALQAKKKEVYDRLIQQMKENRLANKATMDAWMLKCQTKQLENQALNREQELLSQNISMANDWSEGLSSMGCPTKEVDAWIKLQRTKQKPLIRLDAGFPPKPMPWEEWDAMPDSVLPGQEKLIEEIPDRTENDALQQQIVEASETNRKAHLYADYLINKERKDAKKAELDKNKEDQKDAESERIKYIQSFKFPFKNLTVDDAGNLLLNEKPIDENNFSTGELLKVIPILIATTKPELKYVFIQGFNDLDERNWPIVEKFLLDKGFQLVVEVVGKSKMNDGKSILLKENAIVEDYDQETDGEDLEA